IDSSHVSKLDSDVNYLLLEVMPALNRGVIIHIHDIAFPYLCVPREHPLFAMFQFWNEAALLKAFLLFNHSFEVLICQSWLHYRRPEAISLICPFYNVKKHFPASIWLRKSN